MAQNINLLNLALLPKPGPLPAQRLLGLSGLAVAACLALSWQLSRTAEAQRTVHAAAAARYQAEREALRQQIAAAPPALKPEALADEAARLQARIAGQQQLLDRLQEGLLDAPRRHSALLRLLAAETPPGIWLSGLEASNGTLTLEGQALQAPALRDWVSRLSQAAYFAGRPLEQLQAERQPPQSAAAGPAPAVTLPARLKFQLGTAARPPATGAGS